MKPIKRFLVIGDVQPTSFFEKVILGREDNIGVSQLLVQGMIDLHDKTPVDFILFLGDLVFNGFSQKEWHRFDELVAPLHAKNIRLISCVGNHDSPSKNFFLRFPQQNRSGYESFANGPLGICILDSCLRGNEWRQQKTWLTNQIADFQNDSQIRNIALFSHHPFFSNSIPNREHRRMKSEIAPILLNSSKFIVSVSGHAHSYERIKKKAKMFIVSGGGGAPRIRVKMPLMKQDHQDCFYSEKSLRDFHFLEFSPGDTDSSIAIKAFSSALNVIDEVRLGDSSY